MIVELILPEEVKAAGLSQIKIKYEDLGLYRMSKSFSEPVPLTIDLKDEIACWIGNASFIDAKDGADGLIITAEIVLEEGCLKEFEKNQCKEYCRENYISSWWNNDGFYSLRSVGIREKKEKKCSV